MSEAPDKVLLGALMRFAFCCRSCIAPRPGSNALSLLELRSDDDEVVVEGEELEALYRAGMLTSVPDPNDFVVEDTEEYGGIDADYLWAVSETGRTALAKAQEQGRE